MKKKIILAILSVALVGASGLLFLTLQSEHKSEKAATANSNIENKGSEPEKENIDDKKENINEDSAKEESTETKEDNKQEKTTESSTKKEPIKENSTEIKKEPIKENKKTNPTVEKDSTIPESPVSFTNGLTRKNLNGYYKITRNDGGIGYGKLTNEGLFTLDQRPSGTVLTSVDKFTPKSSDGKNKYEFQINGEMSNSSFTVKDDDELYVDLPNFGDADSYTYKRISQSEYEKGAENLVVRENKFPTIGDYYFGNQGQVGTMSSVEDTILINNKKYKVVKSLRSDKKVIISLFGQPYNYDTYKSTGNLVIDNSDMFSGYN
ncbi:MAG: hypothetical protein ACRCWM_06830 [Sarcina sp.]